MGTEKCEVCCTCNISSVLLVNSSHQLLFLRLFVLGPQPKQIGQPILQRALGQQRS